ncbi:unnamed protein product [Rotaria socialis]|uniref:Phosphoglycerate mutase n=1 Tax=Rotaria socialis TaxID=392032 RepID=A0A817URT7_9BILA|nr:unnamed protein product [Rotaria socialis]CAF3331427.1 unnamed protein product [Rotaria socialis]CAF3354171.1 unnamed protein product [Rotaria socialis]CAF3596347.1 unnamed protein product [Rotaria socialis]CAF3759134.1 unnamed protein product [Rotaria socialis]
MMLIISLSISILFILWFLYQNNIFDWLCSMIVTCSQRYRSHRYAKRIILIRHGESQGNQDSNIYATVPDHAIGLTEKGQAQALNCGNELKKLIGKNETIFCYVSPFRRSRQTCELICKAFPNENLVQIREDPRIREQEWGNLQNLARKEKTTAERKIIGRFFYRFGNGESGADVYDRVSSFMDSLYRKMDYTLKPNNNILIVSHGLFMRLFLMRFYRWSVEKFDTLENFDNCDYCILERCDQSGRFILKTELKLYPEYKTIENLQNLHEEVTPSIHMANIEKEEKKND